MTLFVFVFCLSFEEKCVLFLYAVECTSCITQFSGYNRLQEYDLYVLEMYPILIMPVSLAMIITQRDNRKGQLRKRTYK